MIKIFVGILLFVTYAFLMHTLKGLGTLNAQEIVAGSDAAAKILLSLVFIDILGILTFVVWCFFGKRV